MVRIDDAVVVKYTKDGHFEILADPDSVLDLRNGKDIDVAGALAVLNIFKDAGAADKASESELIRVFKTDDPVKIAEEIMKNGDFQPTAEQKRKMITVIRKQVIGIVMQNS
ncbi:MAG: ribosome assembly factor SBDS, partial [Candidatus Altiarchaeota archaeon]|nr:ribosome assembly factor SBDS [Candidatus Altiarchaeota archaeon]